MNDGLEILLVEDDTDTRLNLCDILELDGHRVFAAECLEEARQLAVAHEFHLVILDRRLPDGTAEDFLPELKRIAPQAETVVVTGYADMDGTLAALRQGVADYLLKPINIDALRSCLQRITDRRRIESELQQEQQFASRILRTAEAVILVLDLNGRVIRFNPFFERISGWKQHELIGHDWFEMCIPRRERDRVWEVFVRTAADLQSEGIINAVLTRKGRELQLRWSNTTLKDGAGKTTAVLAVGIDVTDFLFAQDRALQAERLAAIGQTMAALAHESRNALQRIQAGVEMLELDLETDPVALRELRSIHRATRDLHQLLEEVRSFAAPIVLDRETADIRELWRRAWRQLSVAHPNRDAELVESTGTLDLCLTIDVMRIEQVFRNLFDNSLAACMDPVRILIEATTVDPATIEIVIRDNGPGLSDEQREKLFDAFYTTKNSGTGLGMSIVQRIVEAHGGHILVTTSGHHSDWPGAAFVIRLPRDGVRRPVPGNVPAK
jgi:PAS domain S-box-containing protein